MKLFHGEDVDADTSSWFIVSRWETGAV